MVRVIFLHPDLGIGGAERLVVDAGLALKQRGCNVSYVTNHHDPNHCFPETKDGTLPVTVVGDWLPRNIFGYCHAACAYLRMLYLTIYLLIFIAPRAKPDAFFSDQIPVGLPLIKLFRYKVLFYCHFPDQLLCRPGSEIKAFYRKPIDWLEEFCIDFADRILVNSLFTLKVFRSTFPNTYNVPEVLYPSINTRNFDAIAQRVILTVHDVLPDIPPDSIIFLSINRYERKKNLGLAIRALQALETIVTDAQYNKMHLVIMGGYDENNAENSICYNELQQLCFDQKLTTKVTFFKSPSEEFKIALLGMCKCVLYTPSHEHFGIVPLEAMYAKKPVIAVKSGGPKETIEHESSGFLSEPVPEYFAYYMAKIVTDSERSSQMGNAGYQRFAEMFSFEAFTVNLCLVINNMLDDENRRIH